MSPPTPLRTPPPAQAADWPSDEALLLGLSTGVWGAGRALVRRHQGRVYGLALSIVKDPGHAEEIAHETFLRARRESGSYVPARGSVSTWLLTITRDLARRAPRRVRVVRADPFTLLSAVDGANDTAADMWDDEAARARAALSDLPVEQGRAVVLAAIYGYSARQISEVEAIPLDAAKARLRSGIDRLRSHLEGASIVQDRSREPSVLTLLP